MRGKKILLVAVVASGLLIAGCDSTEVLQPEPGQTELRIEASGDKRGTDITIYHYGGKVTKGSESVTWYYDVPEELNEHAILTIAPFGSIRSVSIHLHESKNPNPED